jgi:GNAT superfamily N-acetyltransferase
MKIRPAVLDDLPTLLALGRQMHAESPRFNALTFDDTKVLELLTSAIDDDRYLLIVVDDGDGGLVGGFIGYMTPLWFSHDEVAADLALFVDPDRRGGIVAAHLMKAYSEWAAARGAKQTTAGISTGVMVEQTAQMYRRLGFNQYGYLFEVPND